MRHHRLCYTRLCVSCYTLLRASCWTLLVGYHKSRRKHTCFSTVFGEVIEHPKSTDAVIGDNVMMTCKISSNKCCARWKHNPSGEKETLHSITSNLAVTVRCKDRFTLNADIETGFYNLTIRDTQKRRCWKIFVQ